MSPKCVLFAVEFQYAAGFVEPVIVEVERRRVLEALVAVVEGGYPPGVAV